MKARRRAVVVTALVATVMLLPMSAAHAATSAVASPEAGKVFTGSTEPVSVRATVTRGSLETRPSTVTARIVAQSGSAIAGAQTVGLTMIGETCGVFNCTSTWEARSDNSPLLFDPATLQPFGNTPSCNGGYGIQVAMGGSDSWSGNGFAISVSPNTPTQVAVATEARQATVSWQAPGHPDLTGFDVQQRRSSSGEWVTVRTLGKGTTSVTLTNLDPGPIQFRVRAVRGDGFTAEGDRATPCSDTGRDLTSAWSNTASGTVPSPTSSLSPSPTDGATEPDDESTEPTEGSTEPTEESTEPTEAPTEPEASPSPTPTTRSGSSSRAAPPRVESQERRDVEAPEISQPERRERYYGEDDEFSEELDFGAAPPEDQDSDRDPGTVTIRVPGGLQSVLGVELDMDRVLAPVAGGMILLSLGLHLRRWTRLGLE